MILFGFYRIFIIAKVIEFLLFLNSIYFCRKLLTKIIGNKLAIIYDFIWIFRIFIIAKIASQSLVK
jgi:hypothetical protein